MIISFLAGTTYVINNYNLAVYELQTVRVGNYCLGIQLWIFFVALICSYPGKWIHKLWFSVVGVISINILNTIRIILIIYAAHHYPERIQFNHDYVFNIAIYVFTFLMWILWVNKISKTKVSK